LAYLEQRLSDATNPKEHWLTSSEATGWAFGEEWSENEKFLGFQS
jgi:hypothetical protein